MPEVSVIIPAFNAAESIRRAIDSILTGTFADLECVVVDDGSTDGTAEVVRAIDDDRVRLIESKHQGVAQAMNEGVAHAQGNLIARMDADDRSHQERLERQVEALKSQQLDVVGGLVCIVDSGGNPVESLNRYESWVNSCRTHAEICAYRFVESPVVNPTALARREVFELQCRDGDLPEDYDLWLRAIQAGCQFGKVDEIVLDWIDGPGRLTRTNRRYSFAAFNRCRREHLLKGPLANSVRCNLWGAGQTGKPWLRWLLDAGLKVDFVVEVSPRKIGREIHGVKVIGHEQLPEANGDPLLIAVGAPGAREQIKPVLIGSGYRPGKDAWFVA